MTGEAQLWPARLRIWSNCSPAEAAVHSKTTLEKRRDGQCVGECVGDDDEGLAVGIAEVVVEKKVGARGGVGELDRLGDYEVPCDGHIVLVLREAVQLQSWSVELVGV